MGRRGVPRTGAAPGAGSVPTLDAVYYTLELYCNISTPYRRAPGRKYIKVFED